MSQAAQEQVFRLADDIFQEVSSLRGLPIKDPVLKKFAGRDFFREYYFRKLQERYPSDKKRSVEKAYVLLGFLPENTDIIQTYLDSFLAEAQGFYDPRSKTLFIADWIDQDRLEGILAHELDHALQDQYFDLEAFLQEGGSLSLDAQFARTSVMEGEATAIALNYSLEDKAEDFTQLVNIADWMRLNHFLEESGQRAMGRRVVLNDAINFPYVYGSAFLQNYVKAYGWNGMEYLFQHPPTTTRQILHPDVFFPRREKTFRVTIEDLSPGVLEDYSLIWQDSLGEYGLQLLLRQYVPEEEALKAVEGWRGDRLQVYEAKDRRASLLNGYVVFDSNLSAEKFLMGYLSLLSGKYKIESVRRSDGNIYWASLAGAGMDIYAERFGARVVFIEGSPPSLTSKIRSALWNVVSEKNK